MPYLTIVAASGLEIAIALAIAALLLAIAAWYFFSGSGVAGTLPGGTNPTQPVDRWLNPPRQISVGQNATFVFESMNNNPLSTSGGQLAPITSRAVGFTVTPEELEIVSINRKTVGADSGNGESDSNGQITVVVVAKSLPSPLEGKEIPQGAIIGIPVSSTSTRVKATFTIVK